MKKNYLLTLILALFFFAVPGVMSVNAAGDTTAPVINWVKVVNPVVTKPGIVYVDVNFTEEDLGVKTACVWISPDDGTYHGGMYMDQIDSVTLFSGTKRFAIAIPSTAKDGPYEVTGVYLVDYADNYCNGMRLDYSEPDSYETKYGFFYDANGERNSTTAHPRIFFNVIDEFNTAFETSLSNPSLKTKVDSLREGQYGKIFVDDSSSGIVPAAFFESIKRTKANLVIYDEKCQWIFEGKDITTPKDVNVRTKISTVSGDDYNNDNKIVKVDFADNGVLPGKARFRMKSDYLYSLNKIKGTLKLYHLTNDGMTATLENNPNFDLVFDGTDKWCYFDITHNSSFAVSSGNMKGKAIKAKGSKYEVTSPKAKTVSLRSAQNKKNCVVPDTVKIKGKTYKVTEISANAFTGKNIRTVTLGKNIKTIKKDAFKGSKANLLIIKSKLLKKAKVKGCLKSSKIKTIQVDIGSKKLNKTYVKKYKKFFTKKNAGKKVKVKVK